jgi:FkbM family methyltransferase
MKKIIKSLSQSVGAYNTIRYSKFYYWILKYKNPNYIKALNEDLAFYCSALGGGTLDLVFDVGANRGDKTWVFRQLAKKVVSFDPDKLCFEALRTRYARDRGICLENVALGDREHVGKFYVEEEGSAYNTLNEKERDWLVSNRNQNIREVLVSVSTLDNMILKYGIPNFLKIDVEGSEMTVFNGLSQPVPVICFEANLPRFREESIYIVKQLSSYTAARFNLRLENNFMFSSHQNAETVISVLSRNELVSYDIFFFSNKVSKV